MNFTAAALALCLATQAPADDVLVVFTSRTSTECQSMEPVLRRLASAGVRVETVDVAAREDLVRQFQVTKLPSFFVWSGGKAVARVDGPTSYDRLSQMMIAAKTPLDGRLTVPPPLQPSMPLAAPPATIRGQSPANTPLSSDPTTNDPRAAAERAMRSTVRLRVEDASGASIGTGTIIDVHDDEALVVTCGHLFRGLKRGGKIWIDMFLPGANQPIEGHLLDFDLQRDIAVVAMRPGIPVQAARVGSLTYQPTKGEPVFSIGCDRGAPPSIRGSRVTSINRYQGKPNIEVAGKPVDGRSGGGLFSADGQLIGVCNAADDKDDEGIYAGLATIQWQLESIGQRRVFAGQAGAVAAGAGAAAGAMAPPPAGAPPGMTAPGGIPAPGAAPPPLNPATLAAIPSAVPLANRMSGPSNSAPTTNGLPPNTPPVNVVPNHAPPSTAPPAAAAPNTAGDLELICVVRSRQGDRSDTILISRPSAELLQRIMQESRASQTPAPSARPIR